MIEDYRAPRYAFTCISALLILVALMFILDLTPKKIQISPVTQEDTLYITEEQQNMIFPNWKEADSLYGYDQRFTTKWCEVAQEQQFP